MAALVMFITEKEAKIRRRVHRQNQGDVEHISSLRMRCMAGTAALFAILPFVWMRTYPDLHAQTTSFTLILRTRDPLILSPAALKHYAECQNVVAIRVVKDVATTWNLTRAYMALNNPNRQGELSSYNLDDLKNVLEDAAIPSRSIDLLDARPGFGAAFLVSDALLIACENVALALEAWGRRTDAIVGTLPLGHVLSPDPGDHAWLDYAVSPVTEKHGRYSMLSLNGAFVHTKYLKQAAGRRAPAVNSLLSAECDEIWLNHQVSLSTSIPHVCVCDRIQNRPSYFTAISVDYYKTMSMCLSRLASTNAGKLDLIWTQYVSAFLPDVERVKDIVQHGKMIDHIQRFPIKNDLQHHRQKYLISHDRVAGVAAILVMETKPSEVASAVRHLHTNHTFVREAVVWNNKNETMNHHMFPYDIPLRYVVAPRNYSAYSRYLGCLLARYEICYFQHEQTRPLYVAGLYAAFLMRPDVIVAASSPQEALVVRTNMTFFDTSTGRLTGFADLERGAMVHKNLVRQFVERMSRDDSRTFYERAADADLYFTYSQPKLPTILMQKTQSNSNARTFPKLHRIGKALAFTFTFAPSSKPLPEFDDVFSDRQKYYKAVCIKSGCAFATSINTWPSPIAIDMDHDKAMLAPARHYSDVVNRGIASRKSTKLNFHASLDYAFAVDGDLTTFWQPWLPTKRSFISLELRVPSTIVGIKLWCRTMLLPIPTLQLGYAGQSGFVNEKSCVAKWTTDGMLKLLHYTCTPVRVHRVRLVVTAVDQRVDIAEFAVERLDSETIQAAHAFTRYKTTSSPDINNMPGPPDIGRVVYILHGKAADYCSGDKLAMLEEACELGALYPGQIQLLYVGNSSQMSLQSLALHFAVVGSTCDFEGSLLYETVPIQSAIEETNGPISRNSIKARGLEVYEWWIKSGMDARVVFFDPHDSQIMLVLRDKREVAPNTVFVARSSQINDGVEEGLALADATTVSNKADYILQGQGSSNWGQDRRIAYPLRTLLHRVPRLEAPTTPAIEEVVILVTPATSPEDMELFNRHALPVLQTRADVRLANVSSMQRDFAGIRKGDAHPDMTPDAHIKGPKWRTLRDVMHYVSAYPARVLWILDASPGSAYFASFASVEAARFVAMPAAIPHWESRMLAWNATCEWTPKGFAGKAHELLQGRFEMSSSFTDRDALQHDAPNVIVEEWPIKRLFVPFANTEVVRYLSEIVSEQHLRDTRRKMIALAAHDLF